ncbi:MAG: hypothetical protein IT223_11545 [Crocinitomicaceae bacterium]|nr:hypothetical protein [Crocinitomicaceae bacterium]
MRKCLPMLLLFLCFVSMKAQTDSNFFEAGINVIRLLQFNRGDAVSSSYWSPYFLTAEKKLGKVGIRTGWGFCSVKDFELASPSNGYANFKNDTSSVSGRLGLVFYAALSDNWSLKYGVDGIFSNSERVYNSVIQQVGGTQVESIHKNTWTEAGVSAFIFPQVHLAKRVSLGTELGIAYSGTKGKRSVTSSKFPEFDSHLNNEGSKFSLLPPSALFLMMRF